MKGYIENIERATLENEHFRKVLYTTNRSQLVLMTLQSGEEIGTEVHKEHDQFFRVESGTGEVMIDGVVHALGDGSAVVVPAGAEHNVTNVGDAPLRLYTIYMPPEHKDGVVHATKAEAQEEHFDGMTTE